MTARFMKTLRFPSIARCALASVVLCLLVAGCATQKPPPKNLIVFPPPPDEPRIQYLTSYGSETDLGSPEKFTEFIVGAERVHRPIWKPYGIAVSGDKVYVCDTQAGNISIADLSKRKMRYLKPAGQAALKVPINVAVDKDGTCYVTDTGRGQLLIYSANGQLKQAIGKLDEMKPCGIALEGDRLYVSDLKAHCVTVYDKASLQPLFTVPRDPSDAKAKLFQPTNVAVDSKGRILVSDSGGFAVKIYDAEGKHLQTIGDLGVTPGQFTLPKGVATDHDGRIYVVDAASAVVQL